MQSAFPMVDVLTAIPAPSVADLQREKMQSFTYSCFVIPMKPIPPPPWCPVATEQMQSVKLIEKKKASLIPLQYTPPPYPLALQFEMVQFVRTTRWFAFPEHDIAPPFPLFVCPLHSQYVKMQSSVVVDICVPTAFDSSTWQWAKELFVERKSDAPDIPWMIKRDREESNNVIDEDKRRL